MSAHAKLSASGSKRWLECTPSPSLEAKFPESTSDYANEGRFAHELAELKGRRAILNSMRPQQYKAALAKMQLDPLYSPDMEEHVDSYLQLVWDRYQEAKTTCPDALIFMEQRLDFSSWVPEGFGTGDVVIIADGVMEVIDLKFGKGVVVDAEENSQMMLYGLGALSMYDALYDIEVVKMTIHQPRLDAVSTWQIRADELMEWANTYVVPRAKLAMAGEGEFRCGDHCMFCRAKAQCKARADYNMEIAQHEFAESLLLSDDAISDILARATEFKKWISDVEDFALTEAERGKKWPGWKLVEGRSNRKYSDEQLVVGALTAAGYEEDKLFEKKIYGITAMEKIVGKKKFESLLSTLVIKPQGKPTLAPESDKRPELNSIASAQADFGEEVV